MAEKIVGVYDIKVDKAIKNLDKLQKEVGDVDKSAAKSAKKTEDAYSGMASKLSSQFKSLAGTIGLAFGTQQLVSFGQEAVRVAAQAEGISKAFERLNRPDLLNDLRKATRGTVSDLKLMQQAVRANNFQVPLEKLGSFFEFATKRSIETGESVDYLVQSIVDGIGRKSTLVLDNLGISASELQDEIKRTGDFGEAAANIIERSLAQTGDVADTTAIRIAQLNTVLENTKVLIGEGLISAAEGSASALTPLLNILEKISETTSEEASKEGVLESIKDATSALVKSQSSLLLFANIIDKIAESFSDTEEEVQKTKRGVVGLADVLKSVFGSQPEIIKNLAYYNQLIKDLQTEQKDANTTRERVRELEDEINEAMRQRLLLLGKLREVGGATYQEIESKAITELQIEQQLTDDLIDEANRRDEEISKIKQEYRKYDLEQEQIYQQQLLQEFQMYVQAVGGLMSSISNLQASLVQEELLNLKAQLEAETITREEYEQKRKQILSQQAEDQKTFAIFEAAVNGALAVVNAFNQGGPVLAAVVAAGVAAQVAAIAAQPVPQFAEGGFVGQHGEIKGRKHSQGGVKIEAEGGEFITSAKYAQQNADILKAINSGEWEKYKMENIIAPAINQVLEGGFQGLGASYTLNAGFNDKNLLRAIDRHRTSDKDGFVYLANELKKLKPRKRGGFA